MIKRAKLHDARLRAAAGTRSGVFGRGGARTKIAAATLAARSGACTVIANGLEKRVILRVLDGESVGTFIETGGETPVKARKRWLAGLERCGTLVLDAGATVALGKQGTSLLAVGVSAVRGQFKRGDAVSCTDTEGTEIACGLCNYSSGEMMRIAGKDSGAFSKILGYSHGTEVIHRDNLVVTLGVH